MRHGDGVEDEVEAVGVRRHRLGIARDHDFVRAQLLRILDLVGRSGEGDDVRAHRRGELDAHMAEAADADHADLLARPRIPVPERRIGGDAGAQQRRDCGQVLLVVADARDEDVLDDDMVRIAAERVATQHLVLAIIGADKAGGLAELLLAGMAGRAMAATVDHTAHADEIADREASDVAADRGHPADDLMAGDGGIERAAPFAAHGVEVRMADAAIEDVDRDVVGQQVAAREAEGRERRGRRLGGIGLGWAGHDGPCLVLGEGNGVRACSPAA